MSGSATGEYFLVVMGVAGCGKSTLGQKIADRLGVGFVEGDNLHPPQNVQKMAAGIPLTDQDRIPFLSAVARVIRECEGPSLVVSCSALKRSYREAIVRDAGKPVCFILPQLSEKQLATRLSGRVGHFMPVSMLESQLATFEPLQEGERSITVDGMLPPEDQVDEIMRRLAEDVRTSHNLKERRK